MLVAASPVASPNLPVVNPPTPIARLPRPVLLIAGGKGQRNSLPTVAHYLTSGGNNQFGGVYDPTRPHALDASNEKAPGNVFSLRYSEPFGTYEHNAGEIKQAIADIRRLTGADEVDVIAECKGAMEMREYLEEGNDGVRNLVMLVPPNHGLTIAGDFANTMARALEKLHLPIQQIGPYHVDRETLQALTGFGTDWKLGPLQGNPEVHRFNTKQNEAHESKVLHSLTVIGGDDKNLLKDKWEPGLPLPALRGDDAVPKFSAYLPHAQNFFYSGPMAGHVNVKDNPQALAKMAETLVMDGRPVHDEHYQAKEPGLKRVLARAAAWTAGAAGRVDAAGVSLLGGTLGPLGVGLGAVGGALWVADGVNELRHAVHDDAPQGRVRATIGGLSKLTGAVGIGLAVVGTGGVLPGALILGAMAASALTNQQEGTEVEWLEKAEIMSYDYHMFRPRSPIVTVEDLAEEAVLPLDPETLKADLTRLLPDLEWQLSDLRDKYPELTPAWFGRGKVEGYEIQISSEVGAGFRISHVERSVVVRICRELGLIAFDGQIDEVLGGD